MQLILMRHGETDWNSTGRYLGHTDMPLSEKGLRQAEQASSRIKELDPTVIYSSDLSRAIQTAETINKSLQLPLILDNRLREINFGSWEGKSYEELSIEEKIISNKWFKNPQEVRPSKGEHFYEFKSRILSFIHDVQKKDLCKKKIMVVTHGGVIRVIISHYLSMPTTKISNLVIAPASINIITLYNEDGFLHLGTGYR